MTIEKAVLLAAGVGVIPIALAYGLFPSITLPFLFSIEADTVNVSHIFRAVMALYIGFGLLWIMGAFNYKYQLHAMYCLVIFMFGLATGRIISFILDGMPSWLLIFYLILELGFGFIGLKLIKKAEQSVKEM